MGGETSTRPPVGARAGSSPRGRGATWRSGASSGWCWLIPARAGRYLALGCFFGVVLAHPARAGRYLALGCFFGVVLAHPARAGRYCARTAPSRAPRVALG
ncbi:glutamate-1-semialdehyde 2,1-aminomutase [Actinomyces sp. oral taxon 178 str. F0338]|nr:glutamate-1-semialdehyde 2,1-aminomutase [Actinomyces sp. oral taxon 178 str. F0338]